MQLNDVKRRQFAVWNLKDLSTVSAATISKHKARNVQEQAFSDLCTWRSWNAYAANQLLQAFELDQYKVDICTRPPCIILNQYMYNKKSSSALVYEYSPDRQWIPLDAVKNGCQVQNLTHILLETYRTDIYKTLLCVPYDLGSHEAYTLSNLGHRLVWPSVPFTHGHDRGDPFGPNLTHLWYIVTWCDPVSTLWRAPNPWWHIFPAFLSHFDCTFTHETHIVSTSA